MAHQYTEDYTYLL